MSIDKQALREVAEKATGGEWWSDVVETDGEYGDGEDRTSGYHSYAVYVGSESLLDMTNSTASCIHEEWDHDYHIAWDETAKRNAEFIAAANPATVLVLLDELEAAKRQNDYLREQRDEWERKAISNFEECAEMSARIEELEAQRKLAFTASNRWADKFREAEKRIAELEARTVTLPYLPDDCDRTEAHFKYQSAIAAAGIGVKGE
ncbi:ead/Ea22-like family protein [Salmonella enterica subsp. enterica serovar Corvallis]|uniref:ead/Ea22-like family protein n=1 Tax=Salmonella enterica TaxID=28901 RepID=UPI000FA2EA25|nr:ead/Ea22-like family protein [Salmonella enterica]EAA6139655.1 ead/Ea22-like family protein [Salmonella enterica subsp. enterica serovar Corvallis]EED7523247.1 ead/Ea22-like family protein [Salmonella enterica subsp. enterica serovar Blockley]EEN8238287.1 ead/Ea22-like family protein [Salmonella enterica subsp. enterica serovar Newport]EAA6790990.1 ead/Ea22-like family protein [Salmonella enterica subsp. enterica serovar Corvallis]EAA6822078.1 ead/Ea22-like family protein [Salmonella enteri